MTQPLSEGVSQSPTGETTSVELVYKLGPAQSDRVWIDANGVQWQWTSNLVGWQASKPKGGFEGSFATVEGCGPFTVKTVETVDVTPEPITVEAAQPQPTADTPVVDGQITNGGATQ